MADTKSFVNLLVTAARCNSLAADSATQVRRVHSTEDRNGVRTPYCEVEQLGARLAHNQEVAGSNPVFAIECHFIIFLSQYIFPKASCRNTGRFWCAKVRLMSNNKNRPDQDGTHRGAFEKNKKKIYATQTVCGICGKPVDFKLKYPHPLSPCIDHIIPVSKGGHPSDIDNLQLAHWTCNRQKSDKLFRGEAVKKDTEIISNRVLPQSMDWKTYRSK